ncbi:uncharacterized protein METZ01_LOCUS189217, partial [marine metagenome]
VTTGSRIIMPIHEKILSIGLLSTQT